MLSEIRFAIAKAKYPLYLAWLQKRQRSSGLERADDGADYRSATLLENAVAVILRGPLEPPNPKASLPDHCFALSTWVACGARGLADDDDNDPTNTISRRRRARASLRYGLARTIAPASSRPC